MQSEATSFHTQYHCKPCNQLFSSKEVFINHKKEKRRDGQDHISCAICDQDFVTPAAHFYHMQQYHSQHQDLDCPGCGHGPFKRLGALMAHIERGKCMRIDSAVLEELREEKLEFPRRLEALTKQSIKGNFMKCMPSTSRVGDWEFEKKSSPFCFRNADFPSIPGTVSGNIEPQENGTVGKTKATDIGDEKKDGDSSPAVRKPLQVISTSDFNTLAPSRDIDDPTAFGFTVARYYCSISERFVCPKQPCCKAFRKANLLIGHLRSSAHSNKKYVCPCCLKIFKSLTGITTHVESNSSKCRIRDTDNYGSFLDQLTAGLVDVEEQRHDDGTLRYKTSLAARQRFRGLPITESKNVNQKIQTKHMEPRDVKW